MTKFFSFPKTGFVLVAALGSTAYAKTDFKTEILPILEGRCQKCHKAPHEENGKTVKPKGDIRLDAAWAMLKGSKEAVPVVPGNLSKSAMVEVVTLPKDDDNFMPPKGDPLNDKEIAKIKAWISEGADFGGWEGNLEGKPADLAAKPKAPAKAREHDLLYKALATKVKPVADDLLKKTTTAAGAQSAPLQNTPLLHVDFLTGVSRCNDASVAALAPIKDNIAQLDLARTGVTDEALKSAATMPNLVHLDLRNTKVTDKGLEVLTKLKYLTYLNLFGTQVTDASVATLAKIKSLKHVYFYETQVTDNGVKQLQGDLPGSEVVGNVVLAAPPPQAATGRKGKKN